MAIKDLKKRLTRQLASRGVNGAGQMAENLLRKRGDIDGAGNLTKQGREREALGADGRAKDRAAKASGHKPDDFKYNPKTNRATLKK